MHLVQGLLGKNEQRVLLQESDLYGRSICSSLYRFTVLHYTGYSTSAVESLSIRLLKPLHDVATP